MCYRGYESGSVQNALDIHESRFGGLVYILLVFVITDHHYLNSSLSASKFIVISDVIGISYAYLGTSL